MFDLAGEVLEVFNSLLEPKVTTEDEQIPLEITEMDSNIDFKITIYKKKMEIPDLQMQFDDWLKIEKEIQILYQKTDADWTTF